MASAAAVAVDAARSPLGNDVETSNGVTSAIAPQEDKLMPGEEDDDEDEDIQARIRRGDRALNGEDEEDALGNVGVDDGDLFGDDDDELPDDPLEKRALDDQELDSGDDEGRTDRMGDAEEEAQPEMEEQEKTVMDVDIPRQAGPEPSDGEMYIMKVPPFMSIEPHAWDPSTFQPPETDHHSTTASATFSAFNTATTTIRWRRAPSKPSELQSNARILRWSDGSLTLQLASDPTTQYEISANSLAPPQRNPIKPTPTSINTVGTKGGRRGANVSSTEEKYDVQKDANTYLVAPLPSSELLRVSQKITAGLAIAQSASVTDDAIERLQNSLAAAVNATRVKGVGDNALLAVDEDPELERKRQEVAERDKMRARKRIEAQQERERERTNRVLGRSSGRYGGGGGLSTGMLEDDEEGTFSSRPKGPPKARKQRQRRANSEYSSEEDYGRRGFQSKQDEYDEEDDFLAPSDEEEVVEDDEDEDDGIVEDRGGRERERTPKRDRADRGGEEDAEGEEDDGVQAAGRKRRKVVLEDEDEDEE